MPIITGATTVAPPPPPSVVAEPLRYQWVGSDGVGWDLTDLSGSVHKLRGATGLGFAPVTHWYADNPARPGSTHLGSHDDRGELFLPLEVVAADSALFLAAKDAFGRGLSPTAPGRLTVIRPDDVARYADCWYRDGFDAPVVVDPAMMHWQRYGVTWDRPDPYWSGPDVVAGPFNTTGHTVDNLGDVPVGFMWTVTGPATGFSVTVGSARITMAGVNLLAGQSITADLRGDPYPIVDQSGADRYAGIVEFEFADIPPGLGIPFNLTASGVGAGFGASLRFTPKYRYAF